MDDDEHKDDYIIAATVIKIRIRIRIRMIIIISMSALHSFARFTEILESIIILVIITVRESAYCPSVLFLLY